ncbi:MAG: hypothetical protein F7B78_07340, partial [Desulfurococcales archaeon]|nr:hypothetical protein [Desulfurococcales archaeon]
MKRRGLSPLVATVLLISATVLGGVLVYQYFQNSFTHAKGLSQDLMIAPNAIVLNSNTTLVKVSISNQYDDVVTVLNATLLDSTGNTVTGTLLKGSTLPAQVSPGEKITIMIKTTRKPAAVFVTYEVGGQVYQSEPVQI